MEMIKIGTNGLKIIMSQSDMEKYDIKNQSFDYADALNRRAFRSIMDDAKKKTGFDTEKRPLSVRFYPSKAGGCEIFVLHEEPVRNFDCLPLIRRDADAVTETAVYCFASLDAMVSACRAVSSHETPPSDSYCSDDGLFYLILTGAVSDRIAGILDEYGRRVAYDKISLYLCEHGKEIKTRNSVEYLGEL